jgi:hypothetical protein
MRKRNILIPLFLLVLVVGCKTPEWGSIQPLPATVTLRAAGSHTPTPTPVITTATAMPVPTHPVDTVVPPTPTLASEVWKSMPIIPEVSPRMVEVYQAGLTAGRDPTHFSKIGDCQNITTYFLASLDNPKYYNLGPKYEFLQPTIDHFAGSWSRESLAVKGGLNVAAALNPIWANPRECKSGETPIACEVRVYNPSIVTVSMEESWSGDLVKYNKYLRQIVEYLLSQNIVPILATRAELPGSKNSINDVVTRVAYGYQVPLWNFWAATDPLPSHGLVLQTDGVEDGFHLTQGRYFFDFDDPASMNQGWPWRNLTALEAIDVVYRAVSSQP